MYNVKQLSTLAGVTPRTLHYYDEIGLLKPSQVKDNGYRYYGDEAMMRLQQILLYRELDVPLDQIRQIMGRRDFDVQGALESAAAVLARAAGTRPPLTLSVGPSTLWAWLGSTNEPAVDSLSDAINQAQNHIRVAVGPTRPGIAGTAGIACPAWPACSSGPACSSWPACPSWSM